MTFLSTFCLSHRTGCSEWILLQFDHDLPVPTAYGRTQSRRALLFGRFSRPTCSMISLALLWSLSAQMCVASAVRYPKMT